MAENNVFKLCIIEPDNVAFEGEGTFLEFTAVTGDMGVYPNHIPLTTILEPCVMKVYQGEEVKKLAVLGGFIEILKDKITVLAENAEWPHEIDVQRAESAKKRAEERLAGGGASIDVVRAEAALKRSIARLNTVK